MFCDIGAPDESLDLMCRYRDIKRDIPTMTFDSLEMAFLSLSSLPGWVMIMFPDEIVHEHTHHYVWDLSMRHQDDFDGAYVPILCNSFTSVKNSLRILRAPLLRWIFVDGVESISDTLRLAPASYFSSPIWKMSGFSDGAVIPEGIPTAVKHIVGRSSYSERYIVKTIKEE